MSKTAWTPGPWRIATKGNIGNAIEAYCGEWEYGERWNTIALFQSAVPYGTKHAEEEANGIANGHLIAAAPELAEALSLFVAWLDSEKSGPDYGSQTRDTHPDGERIWRQWYGGNLDLCDKALKAARAALTKARGE